MSVKSYRKQRERLQVPNTLEAVTDAFRWFYVNGYINIEAQQDRDTWHFTGERTVFNGHH